MAARAIWAGKLKLGSAHLPVKLYSAAQDRSIYFSYPREENIVARQAAYGESRDGRSGTNGGITWMATIRHTLNSSKRCDIRTAKALRERKPGKVVDLMEVLKKSLEGKRAA